MYGFVGPTSVLLYLILPPSINLFEVSLGSNHITFVYLSFETPNI